MRRPPDQVVKARETHAWAMRARGMSQARIGAELGLTRGGVHRLLKRIERRELKRMSEGIESVKITQHHVLEHISGEALEAWDRSKTPRKRAASKRSVGEGGEGPGDEVQTSEVVERDGDCSYLYCAMQALGHIRSLWGLDVAPAQQDAVTSIAAITKDMTDRARTYEDRTATEAPAGDPGGPDRPAPGGAPEVPDGPVEIQ